MMTHKTTTARLVPLSVGRFGLLAALATALVLLWAAVGAQSAFARFGLEPGSVDANILNEAGGFEGQASAHPFSVTTQFKLNSVPSPVEGTFFEELGLPVSDEADMRNTTVFAPAGLIGNPTATPRCTLAEFLGAGSLFANCPDSSQIGIAYTSFNIFGQHIELPSAIYNLQPAPGEPALFGFRVVFTAVFAVPSIRTDGDYGVTVNVNNIDQTARVTANKFTLWGVPANPVHDSQRGELFWGVCGDRTQSPPCHSGAPQKALLTNPDDCERGPLPFTTEVQSWPGETGLAEGRTDSATVLTHDDLGNPAGMSGCERVPFEPSIEARTTTELAGTATGLNFQINLPSTGLANPHGIAQSLMKKAVVKLPEGVTVNPSAGEGMGVCTPAQYQGEKLDTLPGQGCPNSSKLGSVEILSPLLESGEAIDGALYLAQPDNPLTSQPGAENPFDTLLSLYIVARIPDRGVIIKSAGRVDLDPNTGRLTTTFDNLPQQPFSSFTLHFRAGARAPLVSAPVCGQPTTEAMLTPYSEPLNPVTVSSGSPITAGVNDGRCPTGGAPPFAPQVLSGTQNNRSGSYSPFYLRISRNDGEQEISKFSTVLPPGLTGNLSGVPFCPDAAIEAARHRTGQQELSSPSCPAASEIGHTLVGAGVGSALAWTPGKVYLAGPYHGSALSLVSITSATVGPFDLGTVVIRFALRINPTTAQAEIDSTGSDPIPHILQGVVVHVREIRVYVDRPNFMLNPTNCDPMAIDNTIAGVGADITNSADDVSAQTATRFQTADCAALKFTPSFKASTSGKASRANGTSLHVRLSYPNVSPGSEANIKRVRVELPKALPSRLSTLNKACADFVFDKNPASCPAESRVGFAKATTPIVPVPLEGPAYFVSHGGAKFPELILVLQGYGITVELNGETFISKTGVTSSTFSTVPDVPVGSFELTLPSGPYSALAANGNLCPRVVTVRKLVKGRRITLRRTAPVNLTMPTSFTAQNGMTLTQNTPVTVQGCAKAKVGKRRGKHAKK